MNELRAAGLVLAVALVTVLLVVVPALSLGWSPFKPAEPIPAWATWEISIPDCPDRYSDTRPRVRKGGWISYRPGKPRGYSLELFPVGTQVYRLNQP